MRRLRYQNDPSQKGTRNPADDAVLMRHPIGQKAALGFSAMTPHLQGGGQNAARTARTRNGH
jgi:hypothetical protein